MVIVTLCVLVPLAVFAAAVGWDLRRKWRNLKPEDKSPLRIKTFDGLDSPYHPSVLFFEQGWNGWRYWMAETPYSQRTKPYWDRNECPSIHVSNDGICWQDVEGLNNPLEDLSDSQVNGLDYFSDPCLIVGPDNQLECWYRLTERKGNKEFRTTVSLRRRCSKDGVMWSPVEIMAQLNLNEPNKGLGQVVVSQAILYDNRYGYTMWYVNMETAGCPDFQGVSVSHSTDGYNWSDRKEVLFDRPVNQWHIDVQRISNRYFMTVFDFVDVSLWESADGENYRYLSTLAKPSSKPYSTTETLYKSCLIKDDMGYKLYLAGRDDVDTFITLLQGQSIDNLDILYTNNVKFGNFLRRYAFYQQRRVRCIFHTLCNRLNR